MRTTVIIPLMSASGLFPFVAMAGVGALLLLSRLYAQDARLTRTTRSRILGLVVVVFGACCVAGAGTALQIVQIGLAGTPPPTVFGTVGRLVGVTLAIALWPVARRKIERAVLFTFVIGAGASGLIGLGLRSGVLDAARALYHLLMFACGAVLAVSFAAGVVTGGAASRER